MKRPKPVRGMLLAAAFSALLCGILVGLPPAAAAGNGPSSSDPTEIDMLGPVISDQTPSGGSEVVDIVTAPPATSVNGQPAGTLSTSIQSPDYTDSPYDLQVYTSTGSGTAAVTGVVTADSTGVVAGALVTLQPSAGGTATTVTSGTNGGFAFVNIPVDPSGTPYTLSVSAAGYGSYTVVNDTYDPDTTYMTTANLTSSAQSFDASLASQGSQTTGSGDFPPYVSFRRPPPAIEVALQPLVTTGPNQCASAGSTYAIKNYPFRFYALHVTKPEIGTSYPKAAVRANMLAITNYGWYFKRHPAGSNYNVTNTTSFQCFKPWVSVPTKWTGWIDGVLQSHYRNGPNADILITSFNNSAGTASNCFGSTQTSYRNNGTLWQDGSRYQVVNGCYSIYQDVDNWYYGKFGSFADSTTPPVPMTSYSRPSGKVTLNFPSEVTDGSGHISKVGWRYIVDKYDPSRGLWLTVYDKGWDWSSRSVPTSFTYNPSGNCYRYRAKANNPAGTTQWASFNNDHVICPG
jgi:hypothetical protein